VNIIDPDVIVLGGGLSNAQLIYARLPARLAAHVFADFFTTPILENRHGDSSGVFGAANLWSATE
jgi:fructokinase